MSLDAVLLPPLLSLAAGLHRLAGGLHGDTRLNGRRCSRPATSPYTAPAAPARTRPSPPSKGHASPQARCTPRPPYAPGSSAAGRSGRSTDTPWHPRPGSRGYHDPSRPGNAERP
jgi:hypothetical protein